MISREIYKGNDHEKIEILRQPDFGDMKEAESEMKVPDLCREHGMSTATFYKWRAKFEGMDVSLTAKLKELEAA